MVAVIVSAVALAVAIGGSCVVTWITAMVLLGFAVAALAGGIGLSGTALLAITFFVMAAGILLLLFGDFDGAFCCETSQEGSLHIGPLYMYIDEPFGLNFVWSRQEGAPKDGAAGNRCTTYAFDTSQIRCLRINSGPGDVKICSGDGGSEKIEVQVAERNYTRYE